MPKISSRTKRVGDLIHRALANSLRQEFKDPRIGMVTVSKVDVTPDLKYAKIFITVFEAEKILESIEVLNKASGFFKHNLAQALDLRFIPQLRFVHDETLLRANRIMSLLESCAVAT